MVGEIEPKDENCVVRKKDEKLFKEVGKGRKIFFLTSPNNYKQKEPTLVKLNKNANSGDDAAQHFGQEFIYILKGAIELKINDKYYILKKGDSMYFDSSLPHYFKNIHNEVTEGLWIASPPAFHK